MDFYIIADQGVGWWNIGERNTLPRPRLTQLLLPALQVESDPLNSHILLGGLASLIHDLAAFGAVRAQRVSLAPHNYPSTPMQTDCASNVMSSTSDTHSTKLFEDVGESRRVVRVLCEYISVQCSRPPPAHSKDLHSTIVAAFTCRASWLFAHPFLATDSECLHLILQVIELGISWIKIPVGCFPTLTGSGYPYCILSEEDLFNKLNLMKSNSNKPHSSAAQHFRYFAAPKAQ
ncbi:hypothetical protein DAPPUDRAFT_266096 [Daphnia pulex]|uniref:Uncharacterized protein n=1 Tax=Daphnia pulex TaxID=6669 RepID=E9HUH3_DAPPU|nr:hypothetical protein DAPPUDRAFT_266096 [Daphnia pulex]|eukprot:EFX64604.1 hypothetical protein DAPPUDRAFT_266096 [Daphnia pulex]